VRESELAFYGTDELVEELLRRKTFLGVIVRSEKEFLDGQWSGERIFKVHFNENMDSAQACRLLDAVTDYMHRNNC